MKLPKALLASPGCDHHVHTKYCRHASGEMVDYVQAAIACGLQKIIFLEHLEVGINNPRQTWLEEEDFASYFAEGEELQRQYGDQLEIGLGVECGYSRKDSPELLTRLAARSWAEIGISCHFVSLPDEDQHLNLFSRDPEGLLRAKRYGLSALFSLYLELLLEAVATLPGTMLCHLDGALRHHPEMVLNKAQLQQVEKLLSLVKEKGMAVEINTSGLRLRGEQFPATPLLQKAIEMEVPLKLSSDAHRPEDVGHAFDHFRKP